MISTFELWKYDKFFDFWIFHRIHYIFMGLIILLQLQQLKYHIWKMAEDPLKNGFFCVLSDSMEACWRKSYRLDFGGFAREVWPILSHLSSNTICLFFPTARSKKWCQDKTVHAEKREGCNNQFSGQLDLPSENGPHIYEKSETFVLVITFYQFLRY